MKVKFFGIILSSFVALGKAKNYSFNVVSILGEGSSIGVKYGDVIKPLTVSHFPLFSGSIEADNIDVYKYVSLDSNGKVIEEESITRNYSDDNINEVYNRVNKEVEIPELPQLFKPMFPMGGKNFEPIPNRIIYNVYANCDKDAYANVVSEPFVGGDNSVQNNQLVNCTITIISPKNTFQSKGSIHLIGFGSRLFKKLAWSIKFDKKFLGRKSVKLRAMASDPTLIREKLSTELYKAVGIPVQEGTYARLFINGDIYGLYLIIDGFSKKWVSGYVHGDAKKDIGISYKLYAKIPQYPDLKYISDDYNDYTRFYIPDEYEDKDVDENNLATKYSHIIDFTKKFNDWVNTPERPVKKLGSFFNIEAVLRLMVIDTLILALDNFWLRLSNAAVYYNPDHNNYVILPYDFDKVLNGGAVDPVIDPNTYIGDCHTWATQHEETIEHFFTNSLLQQPEIKKRYDVILSKVSNELFNTDVISNYIHAVADLIRDDVQWNFDTINYLNIPYNGIVNHYSLQNFEDNIENGHVDFVEDYVVNDAHYGLNEWVELRSESCKADTAGVDTSNNDNISDDYDVEVYKSSKEEIKSKAEIKVTFTKSIALIVILSQFLFYYLF
ncbi:hypothetical protein BCR36DRAFT_334320 [Piromyces finnis]|uniref:Coth-domain-containing protein n=1 Tax=Piromyces finnis TaxID=1754191 RepID=A0A1Y1V0X3_9FUNG|nr:hypothetical protein BCR36DRAFT_334320 [Piromyces finnis]|eukprot:ORX44694.1 hypothetical protein BCR36DRAFT_334320 [Piromyces finnis]